MLFIEVDFMDHIGYDGWIGCEFIPVAVTQQSLGWFEPYNLIKKED